MVSRAVQCNKSVVTRSSPHVQQGGKERADQLMWTGWSSRGIHGVVEVVNRMRPSLWY